MPVAGRSYGQRTQSPCNAFAEEGADFQVAKIAGGHSLIRLSAKAYPFSGDRCLREEAIGRELDVG
jgi:hypothetical protein